MERRAAPWTGPLSVSKSLKRDWSLAWELHHQSEGASHRTHVACQGREEQIALTLILRHRRLLDAEGFGKLDLRHLPGFAQFLKREALGLQTLRFRLDACTPGGIEGGQSVLQGPRHCRQPFRLFRWLSNRLSARATSCLQKRFSLIWRGGHE